MTQLEAVSLFTGIGGFDLAAEQAGMRVTGQVEIDPFCNRVLSRRFPDMLSMEDIRDVRGTEFGSPDVVVFGSPCQDLSVAGKRAGIQGERSSLFFEAARIIGECRPAFAVWENVYGSLSSHGGADFKSVLDAFRELGSPDIAWRTIDSQHAGVPQRRRRVFLVADFRGERAREILFEPEGCGGHPAPGRASWEDVADPVGGGAYGSGRRSEDDPNLVAATIRGRAHGEGNRSSVTAGQPSPTLHADSPMVAYHENISGNVVAADHARALRSGASHSYQFVTPDDGYRMRVRRLTPVECERLQGFPDRWTCLCDLEPCKCPDGPRYRALGNAVTMIVVRWILKRLVRVRPQ